MTDIEGGEVIVDVTTRTASVPTRGIASGAARMAWDLARQDASMTRMKLLGVDELLALPPPMWLIDGILPVDSQAVLYAVSGGGKTFLALDWALCVATGRPWQGRTVTQGRVIYLAGEGGRGIEKRVRAWMKANGVEKVDKALFTLEAVQMRDRNDVNLLRHRMDGQNWEPCLIVIDTFARSFVGGEENSAKEVGEFIDATRKLQQEYGATVLILHHAGKDPTKGERGSSALRAAADTMLLLTKKERELTLYNDKQKDAEEFPPIHLMLKSVDVAVDGNASTSCVVEGSEGDTSLASTIPSPGERKALLTLASLGEAESGAWRRAISFDVAQGEVAEKTFHNWRSGLLFKGLIEKVEGKKGSYRITPSGTAMALPSAVQGPLPNTAATATTP